MRSLRVFPAIVLSLAAAASIGVAQARFGDLERVAVEVPSDLGGWAAPLLVDCRGRSAGDERRCVSTRRRERATLARGTFYVELAPEGRVVMGPYEPTAGGFRFTVRGLAFEGPAGRGRFSTRPFVGGAMPEHHLGEGFVPVSREQASRFAAAHGPSALVLRMVFRVGDEWIDGARAGEPAGYGVVMNLLALQVFHSTSGQVIVDTLRGEPVPPMPPRLEGRATIWTETTVRDVSYTAPDGTETVLAGRVAPSNDSTATREALVLVSRGSEVSEVLRFAAPCCSAAIDARPLGSERVLAILTERASSDAGPGRGQVVLLVWDASARTLLARARWSGSNEESPPAWVTDPTAAWPAESP